MCKSWEHETKIDKFLKEIKRNLCQTIWRNQSINGKIIFLCDITGTKIQWRRAWNIHLSRGKEHNSHILDLIKISTFKCFISTSIYF